MPSYPNVFVGPLTAGGYRVDMFHGNYGDFFGRTGAFHRMGFSHFYDMTAMGLTHVGWGAPDHEVLAFQQARIDSATAPYCGYFITMSSHEPFNFVDTYFATRRFREIRDERTRRYFTCLAYVDSVVTGFAERIHRERPNAYVFIFGDHCPRVESRHFRDASLRHEGTSIEFVPLYVLTPDNRARTERTRAASLLDLSPTLLRAAGVGFSMTTWGQDLLGDTLDNAIPFRDKTYSRTELYRLVDKHLRGL
jgi:phosphoglycerol transferase MdoB-like AlkP superfamily enzyme